MLELMITGFQFSIVANKEVSLLSLPKNLPDNATICTKNPQDHQLLKELIEKDEQLYFISMVRDPRDVVVSRHSMRPEVYWANLRQWREWFVNNKAYKNHPRLNMIRYEDLVSNPDKIQQQLKKRLLFAPVGKCFSEYHRFAEPSRQSLRAMRGVRPVNADSIGNWRNHLPRVAGQLSLHGPITQELIDLGYEKDDQWLKVLDGEVPDTTPGHWPDFYSSEKQTQFINKLESQISIYLHHRGLF